VRRGDQRRAAVVALYQQEVTGRPAAELLERDARPFTRELVEGVGERREKLDVLIEAHAIGWKLDRIAPLELSILRVALHELLDRPDVPAEVAIDEAIESAKELCGADAPAFVNGMLAAVHRAQEAPAG
jgi:transcription antitermination protein NusB